MNFFDRDLAVTIAAKDRGDHLRAIVSFRKALQADPENETALKLCCAIALRNRDLKAQESAVDIPLSVAPNDAEARYFA